MLTVLSRKSRLARAQVDEVMRRLPGVAFTVRTLETSGDLHKELSLLEGRKPDFFTDAIDAALRERRGDIAVHSAKDLPFPLPRDLEVIALTECIDPSDSLVSRGNKKLADLPSGASVGTSSPLRKAGLLGMRPDIEIVGVRGTIEERISQVDNGCLDALVVATCALKRLGLETRAAEVLPFKTHPLQGMLAVVARAGVPALRKLFFPFDARRRYGKVWLVGAGPGDPELLTIKADRALRNAAVIYHDDLVDSSLIAAYHCEKVYVGKRKGNHSLAQIDINELLYESATKGKRVVRLKGGDPLIFGQGGEEIDYLRERFIPVEVISGISSAQAAAADLQMPLTRRGLSNSLVFVSGHQATGDTGEGGKTMAVYMGASAKTDVASRLRGMGFDRTTNVALVRNASSADEVCQLSTLENLASITLESPVMILAGPVFADRTLPHRMLYTGLDATECMLDGVVVAYPLIRTEPVHSAAIDLNRYDGFVFTSRNAVRIFFARFNPGKGLIYAIGPRTAAEITSQGHSVTAQPPVSDSESLNELITQDNHGQRLLYPCSDLSRNSLHDNQRVTPVVIYRTVSIKQPAVDLSEFHAVVFSSSSTIDSFFAIYDSFPGHLSAYVYGRPSTKKLIEHGVPEDVIITVRPGGYDA